MKPLFFAFLILMLSSCSNSNYFINRVEIFGVAIGIAEKSGPSGPDVEKGTWLALFRVMDKRIRIVTAKFDDFNSKQEYIEIQAIKFIDLSGGFIGDDDELMLLPPFTLRPNEKARIFTFKENRADRDRNFQGKEIFAICIVPEWTGKCSGEKRNKGMFKTGLGRGDRILLLGSQLDVLIDMSYWFVSPPQSLQ